MLLLIVRMLMLKEGMLIARMLIERMLMVALEEVIRKRRSWVEQ